MPADPLLGEIMLFAGNFPPRGWALCNGQLLSIAQNTALFSLLGTTYGGNGQTTFALPDLRGRAPIHTGQGAGLTNRVLGEAAGEESHTLAVNEVAAHSHLAAVSNGASTGTRPGNSVPAAGGSYAASPDGNTFSPACIQNGGGGQPHNNMQPYLAVNYCIALQGVFPSRN